MERYRNNLLTGEITLENADEDSESQAAVDEIKTYEAGPITNRSTPGRDNLRRGKIRSVIGDQLMKRNRRESFADLMKFNVDT